jgi:3-oxoacyl-[acyl-carrier-protein] synthase II
VVRVHVAVTGLGVVSALGTGVEQFWRGLMRGNSETGPIQTFDTAGYRCKLGGEVVGFTAAEPVGCARSVQFAAEAVRQAVTDACLLDAGYAADRIGTCFGMVVGNRPGLEGGDLPSGAWLDPATVARLPATEHGFGGPNRVLGTACAAGNSAVALAADLIAAGRAQAMVAGGADQLSQAMFMMFQSFGAMSPDQLMPFDRDRKGLLLGEGSAALVLEERSAAEARGARVYAEVLGHASYSDAFHMTAPHPQGLGARRSMRGALHRAGLNPTDVDYISAHGTGTPANDLIEARAIRAVFGDYADTTPVSSIKGMLGHAQGAASAIESVACLLAIANSTIPANVGCNNIDPDCDIDVVIDGPRRRPVRVALNNAFGFGGNNCCVAFGAP